MICINAQVHAWFNLCRKTKDMKNYVLIFRMDITSPEKQPSPEMIQQYMQKWNRWIADIDAKGRMEGGNHLSYTVAKVLRPKSAAADGPYVVNKESVAGYIVISATDLADAVSIAGKCPILDGEGTSVEVRETATAG